MIQTIPTTTCPRWCAGRHDDLGEPTMRVHVRAVAYGVEITAEERDGVTEAARVYLPDFGAMIDVTPEHAALLAQSLTEAVAIIDGGAR